MAADGNAIPNLSRPIICVVGPTASGKSAIAQEIARRVGGEIISADSMQVYRGMDIGTGKLPPEERTVAHHGLDLVDPGMPYSVALYQEYARQTAARLDAEGKRVILCGGTGFYIRSVIDGYSFPEGEQEDNPVRQRYQVLLEEIGDQALWERLQQVDPASAAIIHPHNTRRVIRAFEMHEQGESYARQNARLKEIPQVLPAVQIGLAVDRKALNARIDARVDSMFASGLVDEVRSLLAAGFREALTAPKAIGYRQVVEAFDGRCTLSEAVEQTKIATHRYAKRQRSWFGRDARIHWIDAALPGEAWGLSDADIQDEMRKSPVVPPAARDIASIADDALAVLATIDSTINS
ncbi:MAG: tRNA (adenosine(37)-N6)-dimethylallyltransferase MiaA [Eggerthellaceae bacterium]|jgi:tRNA dimethylallyltransferase